MRKLPRLLDLVAVTERVVDESLEEGDVGTVVELLSDLAAEVEFLKPDGSTRCVAKCPLTHLLVLNRQRTRVA